MQLPHVPQPAAPQPAAPQPFAAMPAPAEAAAGVSVGAYPSSASAAPAAPSAPAAVAAAVSVPPKKRRTLLVVLITVIATFFLLTVASYFLTVGNPFVKTIGVIDIDGTIGQDGGANMPEGLLSQLDTAAGDPQMVAVVLRVNSGGGSAAAGEEMSRYVANFAKPIVVSTASSNASAAYMISSQADYIFANEASSVGAIGTIMQLTDYSKLLDLLGIKVNTIASADSKDSTYGTRPLTEEEIAYYKAQVDQINDTFIQTVADGRGMDVAEVKALATGMSFTGTDGVDNGLIDEIGTYKDAYQKAASLASVSGYRLKSLSTVEMSLADLIASLFFSDSYTDEKTPTVVEKVTANGQLS